MAKKEVLKELALVERKEEQILKELETKKKELLKLKRLVKNFDFSDLAQVVVGAGVFGLPALINTSFWDYLPIITTSKLVFIHLFFVACVFVTLNYDFRDSFSFDPKFLGSLTKRVFYIYVTVLATILILMWALGKIGPDFLTIDLIRYFLAAHSVALVGAVTFQFIAKKV